MINWHSVHYPRTGTNFGLFPTLACQCFCMHMQKHWHGLLWEVFWGEGEGSLSLKGGVKRKSTILGKRCWTLHYLEYKRHATGLAFVGNTNSWINLRVLQCLLIFYSWFIRVIRHICLHFSKVLENRWSLFQNEQSPSFQNWSNITFHV